MKNRAFTVVPGDDIANKMGGDLMAGDTDKGRRKSDDFGSAPQDSMASQASNADMDMSVLQIDDIKCNDGRMKCQIISSEQKGTGMKKHTSYLIKGQDSLGEINCYRRYSEFLVFRDYLFARYPGLYIPPVPTK